ncbi:MAG TPA: carboxypeptidase-like regulatory domain-containing protein [Acidobacteriaceae bacterium]|nr:carboxypeptidase-like regulatory domain-containing protein [Acidobacteriaceae bacterium]
MRRLLSLLTAALPLAWLALFAAWLPAQDSSAASGYTVRGTVVSTTSGQPVGRALVEFNNDNAMLTNNDGEFSFANLAAGEYTVSVSKPGYRGMGGMRGMTMRAGRGAAPPRPGPPLRIQVGPDMPAITASITPLAMITGHVTLSTADAADGIRVQVFSRRFQNGHARWSMGGTTRTRSDGSFRIANLEPGTYMVSTMASLDRPGLSPTGQGPIWGYPALYFPGVTDIAAAGTLTLSAGQQAQADITLVRQQFFSVAAIVHSAQDTPANFEILDSGGRPTGLSAYYDRRDGIVRAAVPNGVWSMEAHAYGRTMQWGSTPFQVNGAPVSFAINIVPSPHIPVIIHRDFDTSQNGSDVQSSGPGMNLAIVSAEEGGIGRTDGNTDNTLVGDGNGWDLTVMQPGRFWVEAQAYPPAYISSITSGGVDLASNPLILAPGGSSPPIEITLRNNGGSISGQINGLTASAGPTPTPGARPQIYIYAIPQFPTASQAPNLMPNSTGQFSFYNLAPGSYRVVACDAPQEIDFHSPEGLAAWTGKGQTVTVEGGGTASVQLDVLHMTAAAE